MSPGPRVRAIGWARPSAGIAARDVRSRCTPTSSGHPKSRKTHPILIGITIATALVHAVSVVVGALLRASFPTATINVLAGIAFLGFAVWTYRGDDLTEDEAARAERSDRSAVVAAGTAFFLAELGDKTMLATITLATTEGLVGTWIGSTLGMVAADALAIGVGAALGRKLPERAVRIGTTASFVVFGLILLAEGLAG